MEVVSGDISIRDVPLPWQRTLWGSLSARLVEDRLSHALLLTGQPGLGKALFARALAGLALCRSPVDMKACGHCPGCAQYAAGTHPDFIRVTVPEDKTVITVEQIRELIADLQLSSQHGGRKVAIIEPADRLNASAANSLLKTLEEPTPGTLLMLVCARPSRIPATVRSRCQDCKVMRPATRTSLDWLMQAESRSDWPILLGLAAGAPLAARDLAASGIMGMRVDMLSTLSELRMGRGNPVKLAEREKEAYPDLLRLLWIFVADMIHLRAGGASPRLVNVDQQPLLQKASEGINLRGLYGYLDQVQAAIQALETPVNRELLFTVLLAEWANGLATVKHAPMAGRTTWGSA